MIIADNYLLTTKKLNNIRRNLMKRIKLKRIKFGAMEQEQQGRFSIKKNRYIVIWLNKYKVFKSQKQAWRFERATKHITTVYLITATENNLFNAVNVCWNFLNFNVKDCNKYYIHYGGITGEIICR